MKYVNYDKETGKILGFYDSDINEVIPEPNIKITEEQWLESMINNYNFVDIKNNTLSKKDFRTLEQLKEIKKQKLKQALNKYLEVFHLSNGINIENSVRDQTNNLNSLLLSNAAIKSPKWQPNTNYKINDTVYVNDVLLLCMKTGTSGKDAPTPPADFGIVVNDGTTSWAKLGFLIKTTEGRKYFTPKEVIEMSIEATDILHKALVKYEELKSMAENAKSKEELDKIIWQNPV